MRTRKAFPEWKDVASEASQALARLDADRLEELALQCQVRSRDPLPMSREELVRQAREAAQEMTIFARVLEATRANAAVMARLRDTRRGSLEYGEQLRGGRGMGSGHGID